MADALADWEAPPNGGAFSADRLASACSSSDFSMELPDQLPDNRQTGDSACDLIPEPENRDYDADDKRQLYPLVGHVRGEAFDGSRAATVDKIATVDQRAGTVDAT